MHSASIKSIDLEHPTLPQSSIGTVSPEKWINRLELTHQARLKDKQDRTQHHIIDPSTANRPLVWRPSL